MHYDHASQLFSPFRNITLTQGRIERFILDAIDEVSHSKFRVERGVIAESLAYEAELENDPDSHPVQLTLRTLPDDEANPKPKPGAYGGRDNISRGNMPRDEMSDCHGPKEAPGTVEVLKAKYLVGCDGAHSWVRHQMNFKVEGSSTDSVW